MPYIKRKPKANSFPDALQFPQNPARHRSHVKRCTICALILSLSALTAYALSLRLISQIHYLRGRNLMQHGYYGLALQALRKASIHQPQDYNIQRQLGNAVHRLARLNPPSKAYVLANKAKSYYQEAFRLNPLDARSAYGLALQEESLESLYTKLNPNEKINPHNALPFYELALSLRPNGVRYHYDLARYLYGRGKYDELNRVVRKLTRIFPPAYNLLKKQNFWSHDVKTACREGLQEAVKENILPTAAHIGLAEIAEAEKDWANAIAHYRQSLLTLPTNRADKLYLRIGSLYLKNGDVEAARSSFIKSISLDQSREKSLEKFFRVFKKEGALNEFDDFYYEVQQRFSLSPQSGFLLARCFIELKEYGQARRILEKLISDGPTGEAYYWLAQIAGKEKDLDEMEQAIQKATVLDPENHKYRHIFFKLLKRNKKFESAELQLDLMIDNSEAPSASLFDEKAWLRWKQKDYIAALQAWQSAIRLKSDAAVYYARAAEAYVMIGDWHKAAEYYQKAAGLDPQNKQYKKRYRQIKGSDAEGYPSN